jgi:hypothetical protein
MKASNIVVLAVLATLTILIIWPTEEDHIHRAFADELGRPHESVMGTVATDENGARVTAPTFRVEGSDAAIRTRVLLIDDDNYVSIIHGGINVAEYLRIVAVHVAKAFCCCCCMIAQSPKHHHVKSHSFCFFMELH